MQIRFGFELLYRCPQPMPMILVLNTHYSRAADLVKPDTIVTDPGVPMTAYRDGFGNWCNRLVAPAGAFRITSDAIIRDHGRPDPVVLDAIQHPVEDLPEESLVFLLGSRYCETDLLLQTAWKLFGTTPHGWPRVQAIIEFVHQHIKFGYEHARPTKTAFEVYNERLGVCRDFAHLAITFCRCMNIPARYCTGYLGDIGVPATDAAMDFAGWFDAYLGGEWHTFDARNLVPRIGRILIARGRDASDVAITTTFGPNTLEGFRVWTDEIADADAAAAAAAADAADERT